MQIMPAGNIKESRDGRDRRSMRKFAHRVRRLVLEERFRELAMPYITADIKRRATVFLNNVKRKGKRSDTHVVFRKTPDGMN